MICYSPIYPFQHLLRLLMKTPLINPDIETFYTQASEETRLQIGLGPLEFERNKELILRFLPKKKSVVADVGGGPGLYAAWLSALGHNVYLIDPVRKHTEQAQKRASKSMHPFRVMLGEAKHLDLPDATADLVILHGPLYHLQSRKDRLKAITEAKRILKKGGYVLGFAINHTASTMACLLNGSIHDPDFFDMCRKELQTGMHHAPIGCSGVLPVAYFHKPLQLQQEFEEAGLTCCELLAVEGCVWLDKHYFESRANVSKKEVLSALLKLTEAEESLLAFSPHMMLAAKK